MNNAFPGQPLHFGSSDFREGVNWFVMNEPMEASAVQIARFSKLIGRNARPVQRLNNRFVLGQK